MKFLRALPLLLILTACGNGTGNGSEAEMTGPVYHWDQNQIDTDTTSNAPIIQLDLLDEDNESVYTTRCTGPAFTEGVADPEDTTIQTAIRCWWAGGGDDYAVVNMSGSLMIRHRTVDEEAGFGTWETVQEL